MSVFSTFYLLLVVLARILHCEVIFPLYFAGDNLRLYKYLFHWNFPDLIIHQRYLYFKIAILLELKFLFKYSKVFLISLSNLCLLFSLNVFRYLTGMVDKRTLEKYEREAKEKNRETWYTKFFWHWKLLLRNCRLLTGLVVCLLKRCHNKGSFFPSDYAGDYFLMTSKLKRKFGNI